METNRTTSESGGVGLSQYSRRALLAAEARISELEAAARRVHATRKGAMFTTVAFNDALDALAALVSIDDSNAR